MIVRHKEWSIRSKYCTGKSEEVKEEILCEKKINLMPEEESIEMNIWHLDGTCFAIWDVCVSHSGWILCLKDVVNQQIIIMSNADGMSFC